MIGFVIVFTAFLAFDTDGQLWAASEQPLPLWSWEETRRANSVEYADDFKQLLVTRRDKLIRHLPEQYRNSLLEKIEIVVLDDVTTAFHMEADIETGRIETSVETISTLSKIAMASALTTTVSELGANWLAKYLLYIRRAPRGGLLVDPLRASGYLSKTGVFNPNLSPAVWEAIYEAYAERLDAIIMFLIGHELGHFLQPTPANSNDAERQFFEERADRFSLEVLLNIERSIQTTSSKQPYYLKGPIMLFLAWIIGFEQVASVVSPKSHPPNHIRAFGSSNFIMESLPLHALSDSEREGITKAAGQLKVLFHAIEENPKDFFLGLQEESKGITLGALKVR
nr:hypothetical protein [Nitrosomonas nitrosa]